MRNRCTLTQLMLALAVLLAAPAALAFQEPPPEPMSGPLSQLINVPQLVENYARFLARKYNLDETQEKSTVEILQKRTQDFLTNHEEKIFELYNSMLVVRGGGDMSQDELTDWGKGAMPIYQDAKEIIIGGNADWRKLLNDEQRAMHDEDVKLMYESFQTTDDQLGRIVTGDMTVDEFRNPPRSGRRRRNRPDAQAAAPVAVQTGVPPVEQAGSVEIDPNDPPVSAKPPEQAEKFEPPQNPDGFQPAPGPEGGATDEQPADADHETGEVGGEPEQPQHEPPQQSIRHGRQATTSENFASEWERYVDEFIKRHKLDDAQKQAAQKILKDVQEQANRFVAGKRSQLDSIDKQLASGGKPAAAGQKNQQLQAEKLQVLAPINRMFEKQLKPRLDRIPTRAQRQAAEAKPALPGGRPALPKPVKK